MRESVTGMQGGEEVDAMGKAKPYLLAVIVGCVVGVFCFAISLSGWVVVLCDGWFLVLLFALFAAAPITKRRSSGRAHILNSIVLVVLIVTGASAGHYTGRFFKRYIICSSCKPILKALDEYKTDQGEYPLSLNDLPNVEALREDAGISLQERAFGKTGMEVGGIGDADATIYLTPNYYICVVPVTKIFPMSFTRFYVYRKESDESDWDYEKLVWYIGMIDYAATQGRSRSRERK